MNSSAKISRDIYAQLRAEGLAERTTSAWDSRTVEFVRNMLDPSSGRILDAGCGYGRIAIPLVQSGHKVFGLDISPPMLRVAERRAAAAGVHLPLCVGDLCSLPFPDGAFDVVLCMWLTFNELLQEAEQIIALKEMLRVLRPGGWALLDGPPFRESLSARENIAEAVWNTRVDEDAPVPAPKRDPVAEAYGELLSHAQPRRHELFVHDCPGRPRYFLRFWRGPSEGLGGASETPGQPGRLS